MGLLWTAVKPQMEACFQNGFGTSNLRGANEWNIDFSAHLHTSTMHIISMFKYILYIFPICRYYFVQQAGAFIGYYSSKELNLGNEHSIYSSAQSVCMFEPMVPQISMRSSPLSSLSTVNCRVHHFLTSDPEEASSFTGFILHTMDFTLVRPEGRHKNTTTV